MLKYKRESLIKKINFLRSRVSLNQILLSSELSKKEWLKWQIERFIDQGRIRY